MSETRAAQVSALRALVEATQCIARLPGRPEQQSALAVAPAIRFKYSPSGFEAKFGYADQIMAMTGSWLASHPESSIWDNRRPRSHEPRT